jgi:hypothetical protein
MTTIRPRVKTPFTWTLLVLLYTLSVNAISAEPYGRSARPQRAGPPRIQRTTPAPSNNEVSDSVVVSRHEDPVPNWRFAWKYKTSDFQSDEQKSGQFLKDYLRGEAEFFAKARHPESGLTYDGWNLDPQTGKPDSARNFSAASKECLDLALCVKALYGDSVISAVVSPQEPEKAPEIAADILAKKLRSYQAYQKEYPGFAGHVTWFHSGAEMTPVGDWQKAVPTLDMGEMAWSLLLVEKALKDTGREELSEGYKAYNDTLQAKAKEILFEPKSGGVRGHVEISDPHDPHATYSGEGIMTGEHGVHEGQMIVSYMTLFGGLNEEQRDHIWDGIKMKRVEHQHGTTWEGYWGSPHEEWAHLFLPYQDVSGFQNLFRIREKIRSQNAVDRNYPGFAASAHHPLEEKYMSAAGLEGVASQKLEFQDTYTPYGAFPMLLQFAGELSGNVGLAWLHNMLMGPKVQGPMGAGESGDNLGRGAAPVKTIDVSFTNLLALSGGLQKETAQLLKEKGKYEQFINRMTSEFNEAFADSPLREPVDFAFPKNPAPAGSREYTLAP